MSDRNDGPLIPDPRLGAALRWVEGNAPLEEVDWDALRSTIHARAELPVARLRARRQRARWTRPLLPLAVAAGIGGVALLGSSLTGHAPSAPVQTAAAASVSAEEVLTSNLPDEEFRLLVTSRSDPDDLLRMAIDER